MKQFLINLWNAQKNAVLAQDAEYNKQRSDYWYNHAVESYQERKKAETELECLKASLPSRDSKGRFKGKGQ